MLTLVFDIGGLAECRECEGRGRHSTEVAFVLLTQQPEVRTLALPFLFTVQFVDSKKEIEPI